MDLLKELKNLKNVSPDAEFLLRSKRDILEPRVLARQFFGIDFTNSRMAFATLGLVGIFVFGFVRLASPMKVAKVDPGALKAEAQAIDIQIELTNLNYVDTEKGDMETTPARTSETKSVKDSPEPSLNDSIEKALEELAE